MQKNLRSNSDEFKISFEFDIIKYKIAKICFVTNKFYNTKSSSITFNVTHHLTAVKDTNAQSEVQN